jgi:hypothetical protein
MLVVAGFVHFDMDDVGIVDVCVAGFVYFGMDDVGILDACANCFVIVIAAFILWNFCSVILILLPCYWFIVTLVFLMVSVDFL